MEVWNPVLGFEGYYSISTLGRVRSEPRRLIRKNGRPHTVKQKLLSLNKDSSGYYFFRPYKDGKRSMRWVAREVFKSHVRPLNPREEIDHKDSNKINNCLNNLQALESKSKHSEITNQRIQEKLELADFLTTLFMIGELNGNNNS